MEALHAIDAMTLRQALAEITSSDVASLLQVSEAASSFVDAIQLPVFAPRSPLEHGHSVQEPSAPSRPLHHEASRRREIYELRSQVESLEQTLCFLASRVPHDDPTAVISEATALKRECEDIVARQYCARMTAQVHNAQLRTLYADQQRTARKIQRLGERLVALQTAIPRLLESPKMHILTMARVDPSVQVQRLPVLKRKADAVFRSSAFDERECNRVTYRECNLQNDDSEALELIFESAWVLPFAVEDVADALWKLTTRVQIANNQTEYQDIHVDATSLVSQYLVIPDDESSDSLQCGQVATYREHSADGRAQLLTNVQMTKIDGGNCSTVFVCDVWARIEPLGGSMSHVRWCRRQRLQPPECRTSSERKRWIKGVVFGPTRARQGAMLRRNRQQLENALVAVSAQRAGKATVL